MHVDSNPPTPRPSSPSAAATAPAGVQPFGPPWGSSAREESSGEVAAGSRGGFGLVLGGLCVLGALAPPAAAAPQGTGAPPRVMVSTTSDFDPVSGLPALTDAALPMVGASALPSAHFTHLQWQGTVGFEPTDIDAVTRVPGTVPGSAASLAFSLLSNEGGVLDGDVVVFDGAGGLRTLVSEDDLLTALARTDADVDVDALAFDDAGDLLFSLHGSLDDSSVGAVEDGDVLKLDGSGALTRLLTEAEVQTRFTAATGSTAAVGDVNGLSWVLGEPWVTTQGPSSWDGAVIGVGTFPVVILDEAQVGLGGAELDAISYARVGDEIPSFVIDRSAASGGDSFQATLSGAPGSAHVVLFSGATGHVTSPLAAGWGTLVQDQSDPWFQMTFADLAASFVVLDAVGRLDVIYQLPVGLAGLGFDGELGWSFQMLDVNTLELSAPGRLVEL